MNHVTQDSGNTEHPKNRCSSQSEQRSGKRKYCGCSVPLSFAKVLEEHITGCQDIIVMNAH